MKRSLLLENIAIVVSHCIRIKANDFLTAGVTDTEALLFYFLT